MPVKVTTTRTVTTRKTTRERTVTTSRTVVKGRRRKRPQGIILYRGPSMIDGSPIVAIMTGIASKSSNEKTGALLPVYILADNGRDPLADARENGARGICGDCIHGPKMQKDGTFKFSSCYVNVAQGPVSVFKALQRGRYRRWDRSRHARYLRGRVIRLGAYGDPAAVPLSVWESITPHAAGWRGYTHQWRKAAPGYAAFCMASVETEADRAEAKAAGYRTFRVRLATQRVAPGEITCPASAEAGKRKTCADCRACSGALASKAAADVVIIFHGSEAAGAWKRRAYEGTMARLEEAQGRRVPLMML